MRPYPSVLFRPSGSGLGASAGAGWPVDGCAAEAASGQKWVPAQTVRIRIRLSPSPRERSDDDRNEEAPHRPDAGREHVAEPDAHPQRDSDAVRDEAAGPGACLTIGTATAPRAR